MWCPHPVQAMPLIVNATFWVLSCKTTAVVFSTLGPGEEKLLLNIIAKILSVASFP